ncbi:YggT family protein [Candidatus Poribacteria bacterium]|nr:YggT family protein [Candidatus Poribacteria bacterium]
MYLLIRLLFFAIDVYTILIIIRAVISWIRPDPYNQLVQMLYKVTEPFLGPIRKFILRYTGNMGIDFSPLVAIIILNLFKYIIRRILLY